MKKSLFVLSLAALLVFAFATVAGAKYAGYFLDGSKASPTAGASSTPGYLSWGGAVTLMGNNGISSSSSLASTAHGGYITTTTKCAVCHSAHRAIGGSAVGTINNQFLTAGGGSCVQCHTAWGSTQASFLVEWANPEDASNGTAGGPHSSESCENCHEGGIHGGSSSQYWGMNAYLLGGGNDAQITAELPYQMQRVNGGGTELVTDPGTRNTGTATGSGWFVDGSTEAYALGDYPSNMTSAQFAAAQSLLTGYTCSQPGCHVNSVFANVVWGQTYARRQLASSGSDTTADLMMTTGHSTSPGGQYSENSGNNVGGVIAAEADHAQCSPCHAGNPAGGYRLDGGEDAFSDWESARSYGCDQCHDAVGVATNSTAFPHGNRNIYIYQWTNGTSGASVYQTPTSIKASSGNIWMYRSNMMSTGGSTDTLVDPSVTLMQGTVGSATPGNITDGVCLKCHVPADAQSAAAYGMDSSFAIPNTPLIGAGHHGVKDGDIGHDGSAQTGVLPKDWTSAGADINTMNPYTGAIKDGSGNTIASSTPSNRLLYLWR